MQTSSKLLLTSAFALAVTACTGGSGSNDGYPSSAGIAVDGYLEGATATCDTNLNGLADPTELSVLTDATGNFTFVPNCAAPVLVSGGVNHVSSGVTQPFLGQFKARTGSTVVSPLTTLLSEDPTLDSEALNSLLGLPAGTDVNNTDPTQDLALYKATVAVQQIIQELAKTFGAVPGDTAVFASVAKSVAETLKAAYDNDNGTKLIDTSTTPVTIDTTVLADAATAAKDDLSLSGYGSGQISTIVNDPGLEKDLQDLFGATDTASLETGAETQLDPDADTEVTPETEKAYLYLLADEFEIVSDGGTSNTIDLMTFESTGASITGPIESLGFPFELFNSPTIDQTVKMGFSAYETAGDMRELEMLLTGVEIVNNGGNLEVTIPADVRAYVYAKLDDGDTVNLVLNNLSANVVAVSSNKVTLDYSEILDRVKNNQTVISEGVQADVESLANLEGTFTTKLVVTNLNFRYSDASALPVLTAKVTGATNPDTLNPVSEISGYGQEGELTVTTPTP